MVWGHLRELAFAGRVEGRFGEVVSTEARCPGRLLTYHASFADSGDQGAHFTDEEPEGQRCICSGSLSWEVVKVKVQSRSSSAPRLPHLFFAA